MRRVSSPFTSTERVWGLQGASRLRLDPSETVAYYASYLPTAGTIFDIVVATRESRDVAFSDGIPLNTNDLGWDFSPTLPADRSVIYFESRDEATLIWRIYEAVWNPELRAFGHVDPILGFGSSESTHIDSAPYVTPSGDALYFHTTRSGTQALFWAERIGSSFEGAEPVPIESSSGPSGPPACPVVSPDELTLYFAAYSDSVSGGDIWMATRATKAEPFGALSLLQDINTAANEVPSYVSEDGCRLYFDRNSHKPFSWTPPGEAYVAERTPDSE